MNSNGFGSNILVLDGKNWERWSVLMRSLFRAQDVSDLWIHWNHYEVN